MHDHAVDRRIRVPRLTLLISLIGLLTSWGTAIEIRAQDTVTIRTGRDGGGTRHLRGRITDYTGNQLKIRDANGRDSTISTALVVKIHTAREDNHRNAELLLEERRFELALEQFRQAIRNEKRRWMRREILSRIVRCYSSQGQPVMAGDTFKILYRDDPTTPFFDCIPLRWKPYQPTPDVRQRAGEWMRDETNLAVQLIGASWLLSAEQRSQAQAVLERLSNAEDSRVAFLAEAQLWRTRVTGAGEADCRDWRERIRRMPTALRGGPYFVLGRALSRRNRAQDAALVLLRLPILYGGDFGMSADALLAAGRELEKLQRTDRAIGLYREVSRDYSSTSAAREAKQRMQALSRTNPPPTPND